MATSTTELLLARHLRAKGLCCRHGQVKGVYGEQEVELEDYRVGEVLYAGDVRRGAVERGVGEQQHRWRNQQRGQQQQQQQPGGTGGEVQGSCG